jgi:phosphomannomutase
VRRLYEVPPATLGDLPVSEVFDLNEGFRGLPPTEGVWFALGDLGRVVVRPSGTEAKVKAYIEITPVREGSLAEQRVRAASLLKGVRENLDALLRV